MTVSAASTDWVGDDALSSAGASSQASATPATSQKRALRFEPGFYVVRHLAPDTGITVLLNAAPGAETSYARLLGREDGASVILTGRGDMAVIYVADSATTVDLEIAAAAGCDVRALKLNIERLSDKPSTAAMATHEQDTSGSLVRLAGHVQQRGDVRARADGWLGEPGGGMRLEGFSILWPDRESGVDLSFGCTVKGLAHSSRALAGGFVGTRRQASAILEVWAHLIGDQASDYSVEVEAAFAARGVVAGQEGDRLAGEGDEDFLTGLRVNVRRLSSGVGEPAMDTVLTPSPTGRT